ncbi:XAC0095 family protein [Rhodanobacter terrae]|uniref:XAC0095 family protein n=1 Tax=Rhodanobacter terrae TaxID=418647 RepID=A0ABW0STN6_9GAMM
MSTFDSEDLETTGYFLPEDSQLRLKQLREYVGFLTHLARPRRPDEDQEWYAEIRPGEVAICMELLEEQIAQVLDELSWPVERRERAPAPEAKVERDAEPKAAAVTAAADTDGTEPELAGSTMNEAPKRYVAGVTLDQIDELARLGDILRAHGDVVVATDQADFADVTLSIMGDAIIRDAERLRDIIRDVDCVQRLDGRRRSHADVKEEAAIYLAAPSRLVLHAAPYPSVRPTHAPPGAGGRAPALYVGLGI